MVEHFNGVVPGNAGLGDPSWSIVIPPDGHQWLVGGDRNMTGLFFHSVGNVILPIDEPIFFRGVGLKSPTRWCVCCLQEPGVETHSLMWMDMMDMWTRYGFSWTFSVESWKLTWRHLVWREPRSELGVFIFCNPFFLLINHHPSQIINPIGFFYY